MSVFGLRANLWHVYLCLVAHQEGHFSVHACWAQIFSVRQAKFVYDAPVSAGQLSTKVHPARHLQ